MSTKSEHSIRVVSKVTGIAVETLRVWERRYGFPAPDRKEDSNRRLYSDDDVQKLRQIAEALQLGFRPSDVIHKSTQEIAQLLPPEKQPVVVKRGVGRVEDCMALLEVEDVEGLQRQLRENASALGAKRFVSEIAQPMLREVGELWEAGSLSIRQEHLLSECLTTELRLLLASVDTSRAAPTVLLATLPGEPHSMGLEMIAVYLAASQARPRLVGVNTPPEQIVDGVKTLHADIVGLTITEVSDLQIAQRQINSILRDLPRRVSIWVGGQGARRLQCSDPGLRVFSSWEEIDVALEEARRA